ncbi:MULTISPECIES: membrane protein insertase YidC [unclassified Wenzhouxiangella]|uniref:membrane protein insertase YidC n=1 Tax=unclassified Wenzhouxiangella TaxID=2613841 RepID=UPI000E32C172|nr:MULTISPECIES: membrane protein insertase YidC [unclassified Wenzhouxiangella]RFF26764.1 protein translocase component YidC [Wenzhouxiangella sp. 15181]RFP67728.1 protein translocase component YidC [Wenzhouxiangella sp. 15190]
MQAVLAAVLFIVGAYPAVAAQATDRLAIELPEDPAQGVGTWQVGFPDDAAGQKAWRSLVSDDGPVSSRHLALALDGVTSWQPMDASGTERRWQSADGQWQLGFSLEPGESDYRSQLEITLTARQEAPGDSAMRLRLGPGIGEQPRPGLGIATTLYSYTRPSVFQGGEIISPEENGEALQLSEGDWAGLHSRYFALLATPLAVEVPVELTFGRAEGQGELSPEYLPWIDLNLAVPPLEAGERRVWRFELFSGPKTRQALSGTDGEGDYSRLLFQGLWNWMRGLSLGLLWSLEAIHSLVPNWGLAICLLAVLVRLVLYPLGRWALSSQQRFSEVQAEIAPKVREIKQNYKGGEQSERILQLYEQRGVSPLAGLKPLLIVLIQIPVFVALFHVLGQVFEFRNASFLWIDSLAEPDRLFSFGTSLAFFGNWFNLLPVLMAVSTLASIRLSPAPAASQAEKRRQNLFLWFLAAAFFLLFYPFPSGMVLYWIMANVLYIAQFRLTQRKAGTAGSG